MKHSPVLDICRCVVVGVFQPASLQNDIIQMESDSSVEYSARRAEVTAGQDEHEQVRATTHGEVPGLDSGPQQRASVIVVDDTATSASNRNRKSGVSGNAAADLFAKLVCVGRKMKQGHSESANLNQGR